MGCAASGSAQVSGKLTHVKLNDGNIIPSVGLGVYEAPASEVTVQAVLHALKAGYRHIDTAAYYKNEKEVGEAIKQSGLKREEIFVTTKVFAEDHGFEETKAACRKSLELLGTGYIDLYLIHAPAPKRVETWKALEELKTEGVVKSIGVSNYGVHHLKELFENSKIVPAVNQIELTPYLTQKDIVDVCKEKGIAIECYCPLTRGERLGDPKLVQIAEKYNKKPEHVLLRWSLQHGYIVLPKSVQEERIKSNFNVFDFELTAEEVATLDGLNENHHFAAKGEWDPTKWP